MPGFTAVAVIVISVGIGSNTAVFSVINTVLLKPLTYPEPKSLVQLMETGPQGSFQGASVPKFNILRQQSSIFQYVAGYDQGGSGLNLTGGGEPEQVQGIHVTSDYFRLFGAPILQREAEVAPGVFHPEQEEKAPSAISRVFRPYFLFGRHDFRLT